MANRLTIIIFRIAPCSPDNKNNTIEFSSGGGAQARADGCPSSQAAKPIRYFYREDAGF